MNSCLIQALKGLRTAGPEEEFGALQLAVALSRLSTRCRNMACLASFVHLIGGRLNFSQLLLREHLGASVPNLSNEMNLTCTVIFTQGFQSI
jgi:hypothetical protein